MPQPQTSSFTVFFVCTGNICRSALAERLARSRLEELLGDDAAAVRVASAGVRAVVGSAMHPHSAAVLRSLDGHGEGFVSRQLVDEEVLDADLVLAMTREHRRAVLELVPRALNRTFTLREAADLVRMLGDADPPGEDLAERARELVRAMAATRARRASGDADDIADPIGGPLAAHQEAGEAITGALLPVLHRIASLRAAHLPS